MRILIVEDDHLNRTILSGFLSEHGQCDACANGAEAVEKFAAALDAREPYSLVMMDIWLPEKNGMDALRDIRAIEQERDIPPKRESKVIILTVDDDPTMVMDAFRRCGATDYLLKPVDLNRLEEIMREQGLLAG